MSSTIGKLASVISLALLTPLSALAEVRGGDPVTLRVTERGPWSMVDASPEAVLNPMGDLRGDGPPTILGEFVAYVSPATSSIQAWKWSGRWEHLASIPALEAPFGSVVVARHESSYLLSWSEYPSQPRARLAGVLSRGGHALPLFVTDGFVVDLVRTGETFHLLVVTHDGWLKDVTITVASIVPSVPTIIDRLSIDTLDRVTSLIPSGSSVGARRPSSALGHAPRLVAKRQRFCPDIRTHAGFGPLGEPFALETHWRSPFMLVFTELGEAGPLRTERLTTDGGEGRDLVSEAIEIVRQRH